MIHIYIKTPFNPYPDWGPNESPRDNNPHMVSILSLYVQPSVVDYKKIYSLRPIFWLESKLTPAKKNKTKQKQTSTVVKLLVAESAVKVH